MDTAVNGQRPLSAIDRVRRAAASVPQRILVPEWADEHGQPLEIFYMPITGLDDQAVEAREPKSNAERLVYRLILKARDEEGRALFRWPDAPVLMQAAESEVVARIVLVMMGIRPNGLSLGVDEAKQMIGQDPNSTSSSSLPSSSTSP